jgi:hypothetical protein
MRTQFGALSVVLALLICFLAPTSVAATSHLRTTKEVLQLHRHLEEQCVPPGGEIPCTEAFSEETCDTCCYYDPNDLTVYFEDSEVAKASGMQRKGCYAILDQDESLQTCVCGPGSSGRNEEEGNSGAPVAAPSPISATDAPTSAPMGLARVETCLLEGATVDVDPDAVCDYSNCCSNFCGCITNPNSVSCRCSPAQ